MHVTKENERTKLDNAGIASIFVTIILSLVITLIVTGFAAIARREQRQALDEQLSTQAFYAAESEVNKIMSQINSGSIPANKNTCYDTTQPIPKTFNGSPLAITTCLLITSTGAVSAGYTVPPDEAIIAPPIKTGDPAKKLVSLHIEWQSSGKNNCLPSGSDYNILPNSLGSGQLGMLRVDLTKVDGSTYGRQALSNATQALVLYPNSNGADTQATYTAGGGSIFHSSPRPDEYDFFNTAGDTSPASRKGKYPGTEKYVGYKENSEWNNWRDNLAANPTARASTYTAANNYGPASGSYVPTTNWMAFWNWYDDYLKISGAPAIPDKDASCGFLCTTQGQYDTNKSGVSGRDGNFKTWASDVIEKKKVANFPDGNPNQKYYGGLGSRTVFGTGDANSPLTTGSCIAGSPATGQANILFNGSDQLSGDAQYMLKIKSLYLSHSLSITAYAVDSSGVVGQIPLSGGGGATGQVTIEATAKVGDIVRRIQARVPYGASGGTGFPDYSIRVTGGICKLLDVAPYSAVSGSGTLDSCPPN